MPGRLTEVDLPARLAPSVPSVLTRALTGMACALLAIALRYAVHQFAPGVAPFAFIFPAVLAATMISGWMAGALALALSGVADWALFLSGPQGPGIPSLRDAIELALFTISAGAMVFLTEAFVLSARLGAKRRAHDLEQARLEEERQRWIAQEMTHRVKNTLAIVQNIARQSFRGDRANPAARAEFEARLAALAAAHGLLLETGWRAVELRRLVEQASAPFGDSGRFQLDGPDVRLPPAAALAMALAIHELATNATKYGALSNSEGRIRIRWRVFDQGQERRFELTWEELGGPPVKAPKTRGFGSRLVEQGLAHELGGSAVLRFPPSGAVCTIVAPAP